MEQEEKQTLRGVFVCENFPKMMRGVMRESGEEFIGGVWQRDGGDDVMVKIMW
jgi:hypothetical protein